MVISQELNALSAKARFSSTEMTTPKRQPRLDLNPSSADRWTTCTASPRFILENWDKVQSSDTIYNQEGTTAHEVVAAFLQDRQPRPSECPVPVDSDMLWHGWNYMEHVLSCMKPGGKLLVEMKLPLWYMKDRNAIVDAAVINDDCLHVIDYKYGAGIPVHPENNLQAAIYAFSVGRLRAPIPSAFPVFIHIFQPRGRNSEDGPAHIWETTWLDVCKLTQKVSTAASFILEDFSEMTKFAPSEKACQWCPAKGFCTARQQSMADGLEVIDHQSTPLPSPGVLSQEQLVRVLTHKKAISSWLDDVEEWAEGFLKGGGTIPGFKLVESRGGNRRWSDPAKAAELLLRDTVLKRAEVISETTISPGAAEKMLGKHKFSVELTNLIVKAPGAPTLAPESDKRPAIGASVLEEFEVLDDSSIGGKIIAATAEKGFY